MLFDIVCVRFGLMATSVSLNRKFMRVQNVRTEKCARVRNFLSSSIHIPFQYSCEFPFRYIRSVSLALVRPLCMLFLSVCCHRRVVAHSSFLRSGRSYPSRANLTRTNRLEVRTFPQIHRNQHQLNAYNRFVCSRLLVTHIQVSHSLVRLIELHTFGSVWWNERKSFLIIRRVSAC